MVQIERNVAGYLLQSKAIILEPSKPFKWASGWISPIYCDNRITLSFPHIRDFICHAFVESIRTHFGEPDLVAGVATGAIAHGVLVADRMELPFAYIRSSAKEHGRKNLVEGRIVAGQRVVVVEDLVSTGGSSLGAVEAVRDTGAEVVGMAAIFSYGFDLSREKFSKAGVKLITLTNYHTLVEIAMESDFLSEDDVKMLDAWHSDPAGWKSK